MIKTKNNIDYGQLSRKYGTYIILLLLFIISTILRPQTFPTINNLVSILVQVSMIVILACGETLVIIGGGTDLSPGSVVAMTGSLMVGMYIKTQSIFISLIIAVAMGAILGFINGFFVTRFNLMPFIVTLGTQILARGLAFVYSGGMPIPIPVEDTRFKELGQGKLFGIPKPIYVAAAIVAITVIIANYTSFGRAVYAIGGNKEAARASGIKIRKVTTLTFVYLGVMGAIAGYILMSRINVGQPNAGVGYESDAIIGTILGGTSFSGGIGTVGGSIVGCIIMGMVGNIMNLTNITPHWQYVIKGIIILFAVTLDSVNKELSLKRQTKASA